MVLLRPLTTDWGLGLKGAFISETASIELRIYCFYCWLDCLFPRERSLLDKLTLLLS